MDMERLKHQGRLAEKEQTAKRLDLSIRGDIAAIRDILDPFSPLPDLRVDVAAVQAVEMAGKHAEYCGLLAEIKAIKKALGI